MPDPADDYDLAPGMYGELTKEEIGRPLTGCTVASVMVHSNSMGLQPALHVTLEFDDNKFTFHISHEDSLVAIISSLADNFNYAAARAVLDTMTARKGD